jgi:predicted ATPase
LDGLIDKSLVALGEERAGQGRYRMLEVIRGYATERLGVAAEVSLLFHRHAAFYAQLARDCAEMEDTASSLDRLAADHPICWPPSITWQTPINRSSTAS